MRNIYNIPNYRKIDQGLIFSGGIAINYIGKKIYGIIITPRCDLEHKKNAEVHYLPVIPINEWILVDGKIPLIERTRLNYVSKIKTELNKNNIDTSILINNTLEDLQLIIEHLIKNENKRNGIISCISKLKTINKFEKNELPLEEIISFYNEEKKQVLTIIKELAENKKKEYYLLEPIEPNSRVYNVVLNREIKRIEYTTAEKISGGLYISEIIEGNKKYCDFNFEHDFIEPLKVVKSPYLEHLIQHFISNFGRIGVADHNDELPEQIIKILKYD